MEVFVLVKQNLDTGVLEFEWFENEKDAVGAFNEFIVSSERKTNNYKLLETTSPNGNVEHLKSRNPPPSTRAKRA